MAQIQNEVSTDDQIMTRQQNIQYFLEQTNNNDHLSLPGINTKKIEPDTLSVASSMHFTVVNMNTRPTVRQRSFCRKHQLTILILTMSALFTIGIMTAIFLLESEYYAINYQTIILLFLYFCSESEKTTKLRRRQ